tara:strand:- start:3388 stop:4701 length:1314 start_codon:yes stop_codon:yes gene_type:complete
MISVFINFILFSGLFYFAYILLFRNKSFFNANRWLLLLIPLISILIPWLAPYFNDPIYSATGYSTQLLPEIKIFGEGQEIATKPSNNFSFLLIIYTLGIALSAMLFIKGLLSILKIVNSSEPSQWNHIRFAYSEKAESPFSFFKHIILPGALKKDKSLATILTHEEVHQREFHSYDNLYYNILSILFWFNPFIHLLAKELRQTHECIADRSALKETSREVYAQMLLSSTFGKEVALPANPFFNPSLLKTRITMLYKNESPKWLKLSYLAILPLALAMTLHGCNKAPESVEAANIEKSKALSIDEVSTVPLFKDCDKNASADEKQACFKLGIKNFLIENLKYPEEAYNLRVEGKVLISFIIDERGKLIDAEIVRGINLSEEASSEQKQAAKSMEDYSLTLVQSMPDFEPAKKDAKPVAMKFKLPISYQLPPMAELEKE